MRNMSSPHFCNICKENMWLQFFQTVSAIDNLATDCTANAVTVDLQVIPLGQFREIPIPGEQYTLTWLHNGVYDGTKDNVFVWTDSRSNAAGEWTAQLKFITQQVRQDPNLLLEFEAVTTIPISGPC